jgi:flagellar export protein FliJ
MRKDRLQNILHLAEVRESTAVKEFASARQICELNQSKLSELCAFRDDYQSKGSVTRQSAGQFESTRRFLCQLSEVIDQQEEQVAQMLNQMSTRKETWLGSRVKRRSVELFVEKRMRQQVSEEQRREQKELDEISQRRDASF